MEWWSSGLMEKKKAYELSLFPTLQYSNTPVLHGGKF
jgi:hypothetical protein